MYSSRTAALAAVPWLALALLLAHAATTQARPAPAGDGAETLAEARQLLAHRDAPGAVARLEAALPGTSVENRPALISLLREAYEAAARQAEAAGHADEAEGYRDNLAILARKARRTTPEPSPAPAPAAPRTSTARHDPPPALIAPAAEPKPPVDRDLHRAIAETTKPAEPPPQTYVAPLAEPRAIAPAPAVGPPDRAVPNAGVLVATAPIAHADRSASPTPAPAAQPQPASSAPPMDVSIAAADAAFVAKRYDVAGPIYAELDRRKALPRDRRDHWAYCRAVEVVKRINAKPTTPAEWAAIDGEIEQIRRLSPTNWFAEYLRNRAAERNPGSRDSRTLRANKVVVRGAQPDEPPAPQPQPQPQTPAPTQPQPAPAPSATAPLRWSAQPVFTDNFQVIYPEGQREQAEQVARMAEATRATLSKRWGETTPGVPWSPRCEVVLFPNGAEFHRATGQPPDSPGISNMRMTAGRIDGRRINLRMDHPNALRAVLPHEVTHVVLADLFPHKQIPRWADEGVAVLSEPASEQNVRVADLSEPLAAGKLFRLNDLVAMDYPDPQYLNLYYAQSVSLTRFLVEQGTPAQFIKFVQQAQWNGYESSLKQVYEISDFNTLYAKWLAFAKARSAGLLTATSDRDPAVLPARR